MTAVQVGTVKTEVLISNDTPQIKLGTEKVETLISVDTPQIKVGTIKTEALLLHVTDVDVGTVTTEVMLLGVPTPMTVGSVTTEALLTVSGPAVNVGTVTTEVLLFNQGTFANVGTVTTEVLIENEGDLIRVGNITEEVLLLQVTDITVGTVTSEALITNEGVNVIVGNVTEEVMILQVADAIVGDVKMEALLTNDTPEVFVGNVQVEVMLVEFVEPLGPTNRITWDDTDRLYFEGVSKAVLYPQNSPGVAWNGMISVTELGDDPPASVYVDGQKVRDQILPGTFAGTIVAFTYPDEFEPSIGVEVGMSSQPRQTFGFSYRDNREIHLVYNALVAPSNDLYATLSDTPAPVNFSWDFTTIPVDVFEARPTSHLVITLDYADDRAISDLEDMLYGSAMADPFLPDPAVVLELFESYTTLRITDNLDGTWTADGPDTVITFPTVDTFQIDWPSAIFITADTYRIYSL